MTPESARARAWTLVTILVALPLTGFWLYGLFDVDEGFYAAVVSEMLRRGDFITPFYNGSPWFEKPILMYWAAAPAVAAFGEMIGPRLPSILAILATYLVVARFLIRRISDLAARWAVMILGTSLLLAAVGRMMLADPLLILTFTAGMILFLESLIGDARLRVGAAACLGLSVLAKGPVGLALFLVVAIVVYWREKELRPRFGSWWFAIPVLAAAALPFALPSGLWLFLIISTVCIFLELREPPSRRGYWATGTLACLLVLGSWYYPAYLANGQEFIQGFFIEQNLKRFGGGDEAHRVPAWAYLPYYFVVVLLGMLPWSLSIPKAFPSFAKPDHLAPDYEQQLIRRYLAYWALAVFTLFTLAGSKLPHYILPAMVPLGMLVAIRFAHQSPTAFRIALPISAVITGIVVTAILTVGFPIYYERSGQAEVHGLARYLRLRGGEVAVYQMGRRQRDRGTGRPKLQETSLPSLVYVLNRTALKTDNLDELLAAPRPLWVLTRAGRFSPADLAEIQRRGGKFERVETPVRQENFEVWQLKTPWFQ